MGYAILGIQMSRAHQRWRRCSLVKEFFQLMQMQMTGAPDWRLVAGDHHSIDGLKRRSFSRVLCDLVAARSFLASGTVVWWGSFRPTLRAMNTVQLPIHAREKKRCCLWKVGHTWWRNNLHVRPFWKCPLACNEFRKYSFSDSRHFWFWLREKEITLGKMWQPVDVNHMISFYGQCTWIESRSMNSVSVDGNRSVFVNAVSVISLFIHSAPKHSFRNRFSRGAIFLLVNASVIKA